MSESTDLQGYCTVTTTCDPYPGPSWSMEWCGPGTRYGSGAMQAGEVTTEPIEPDQSHRYFGVTRNNGYWFHADPGVRELYGFGDDVTRREGTRKYWTMNFVHPDISSSIETLIDDALGNPIILKVAIDPPRPGEDPNPEAELAARNLQQCQNSIDRLNPYLDDVLRQVVESVCVEFSGAAEPVWETVDGVYLLSMLNTLGRDDWEFIVDGFNTVVGYRGYDPTGKEVNLPLSKLAVMTWRPRSGDPGGRAMLRPAYADCDRDWRLENSYFQHVKNFSDPYRVAKVGGSVRKRIPGLDPKAQPGDPNPDEIHPAESVQYLLSTAGSAGFIVIGREDEIISQYPSGSGEPYINAFKLGSNRIVKSIIGDVRATQQAEYGSRASAEVGERNKGTRVNEIRRLVINFVSGILRTQTELNYGTESAAKLTPYVLFGEEEEGPGVTEWASAAWRLTDKQMAEVDGKLGLTPREVGSEESSDYRLDQAQIAKTYEEIGVPTRLALKRAGWTDDELAEYDSVVALRQESEQKMLGDGAKPSS